MSSLVQIESQPEQRDQLLVYLRVNGCYFWFNIFQILTTVAMLLLLYLQHFFIVTLIQILITFMVALDLLLRYFSQGPKHFISSLDNRINFVILSVLSVSIGSDIVVPEYTHHDGGIMAGIFLFIRYALQISRLCRLVIDSKKHLQLSQQQIISLSEMPQQQQTQQTG